jgi:Ricin-type beta-trefoil lectin domain
MQGDRGMKRMGKIAGMLAAVTLVSGSVIGVTGTAYADVVPPSNTWAEIFDPYTSAPACLDDPGGSTAVNTPLELWHCHGYDSMGTPQRWTFLRTSFFGPNTYLITTTTQANLCPGTSAGASVGTRVVLVTCHIGLFWTVLSRNAYAGDPVFQLELGNIGLCMALPDSSGGNAEPIILEPCGPGSILRYWMFG